jgi:hypothetical protein
VKLTLSNVAVPSAPGLCEHSKMPTVAEAGIVGRDLFEDRRPRDAVGAQVGAEALPERTSFIQTLGKV